MLLTISVAPSVKKYGVMGWLVSSTTLGSAAPGIPEEEAGPANPMVAYVSSAKSGKTGKKAGLIPDALHEELNALLNAPSGVEIESGYWSLPNTALMRSDESFMLT